MDTQEQTYLLEQYERLPEDIQKLFLSNKLDTEIQLIGKEHRLSRDQTKELADEVELVLLGILPPAYFLCGVKDRLDIEDDKARTIIESVNEKIFSPFKKTLSRLHQVGDITKEILPAPSTSVEAKSSPNNSKSFADEVLGTHKKVETGSVLIHPETEDIKAAKEALSTSPAPSSAPAPTTPPQNLPGAKEMPKETIVPKTISPEAQKPSAYPVPPAPTPEKVGPSDEASDDIKIPENIFEAKLRQVSESLEDSETPKPPASPTPSEDPYREPLP